MTTARIFALATVAVIWGCALGLQRPPPRYSQQYMPQTSFTCRNKIVGSYYADPETDCQLFHVCVSVAGSIQDYRFLCPNDTAFDQESQTCADWYDVDCEAATLYYASDNFDLYRIGSGLESLHYDSIRSDLEPQDHLQRSESNDPIRSPLNSFNSNSYKEIEATTKKNNHPRGGESNYASRNQKTFNEDAEKDKQYHKKENEASYRKINRKPATNVYTTAKPTTAVPAFTQNHNDFKYNPTTTAPAAYTQNHFTGANFAYSQTSQRPASSQAVLKTSTARPTTKYAPVKYTTTTARTTANSQDAYQTTYQTTTVRASYNNNNNNNNYNRFETTAKPSSTHYTEPQSYYSPGQFNSAVTTKQPVADNYQQQNYNQANNYEQRNNYNNNNNNNNNNYYNNHNYNSQKINTTSYPSSTAAPKTYDNHNYNNNNNNNYNNNYNGNYENQPKKAADNYNQNVQTANTYAPTTYSPVTKKFPNHRQYYEKSTTFATKPAQYTETVAESTKTSKKPTQYKNYQNYETSTRSYEFGRSSVGLGFSPSSVNHLAENVRPTTPTPRRAASPTTYNPNSFIANTHAPQNQATQQKSTYHQNQSSKQQKQQQQQQQQQYSTTAKYFEDTTRAKITKKNDYDYAYYDNGPLEYENLELEHVTNNKESVKIT